MRIGINASYLRKIDTGIGQVTNGFIRELAKSGPKENEYFLYLENEIALKLPKNFKKRVFLPIFWKRDDLIRKIWWEKFLLPRAARKDRCDVFVSLYQAPVVLKNTRHVMLVHDMILKVFPEYLDNWRKKLYAHLCWSAAKKATEIVTISEWSKKDIHKYLKIPLASIRVANPSVDKIFFEEIGREKDNETLEKYDLYGRYVFYIGGFDFRKNVSDLLKAYKLMIDKNDISDVSLALGGEDKSKFSPLFTNVRKEIENLGLEEKVKLLGFVEQKDLPAIYRNAELFVLPSLYEGFGLMALEAMASGVPAAVSKTSSLPEVGGSAVVYFNPYETEEIARVMGKILRNNKLRLRLREKGRERATQFSWKKFAETILAI